MTKILTHPQIHIHTYHVDNRVQFLGGNDPESAVNGFTLTASSATNRKLFAIIQIARMMMTINAAVLLYSQQMSRENTI